MKNFIQLTLIAIIFSSFTVHQSIVYVCKGPLSKVYHQRENCNGLSKCSTQIYKISVEEAKKMGRRMCKIEN